MESIQWISKVSCEFCVLFVNVTKAIIKKKHVSCTIPGHKYLYFIPLPFHIFNENNCNTFAYIEW